MKMWLMLWLELILFNAFLTRTAASASSGLIFSSKVPIVEEFTEESISEELLRMKAAIEAADYIAFDNELGGFINNRPAAHDSPADYYRKVADSAEKYSLLQFGFTTVKYLKTGVIDEQTWSIYLADNIVTVNPASGGFLVDNCFDWNKLYHSTFSISSGKFPLTNFMQSTLLAAKKPLICHNCLADLLHIMKYFSVHHVPRDIDQFTNAAKGLFTFYDTKVMFLERMPNARNPESSLSACYGYCKGPELGSAHGAGVDSLMTARVFATLLENRRLSEIAFFKNTLMFDMSRYYSLENGICGYFQRSYNSPSHPHNRQISVDDQDNPQIIMMKQQQYQQSY